MSIEMCSALSVEQSDTPIADVDYAQSAETEVETEAEISEDTSQSNDTVSSDEYPFGE